MPPKNPQLSYTNKPVRKLRLPKIAPLARKGFFEEYFYACVGALFLIVAVLCWAGGMKGYDAIVLAAWIGGAVWCGKLLKGYFLAKYSKEENKNAPSAAKASETNNGKMALPRGMKPIIGIQWPVKSGAWPARPGLKTAPSIPPLPRSNGQQTTGSVPTPPASPGATTSRPAPPAEENAPNKAGFRYERPTLPERKTKLPNNWLGQKDKKPKR